jgi:hypothetical protein
LVCSSLLCFIAFPFRSLSCFMGQFHSLFSFQRASFSFVAPYVSAAT